MFINFCLKFGHGLIWNIQSPHELRQLIVLWKVQTHNIKLDTTECTLSTSWSRKVNDRSSTLVVLISGVFVRSRLITKVSTPEWYTCISQCPQELVPYATRNPHVKKGKKGKGYGLPLIKLWSCDAIRRPSLHWTTNSWQWNMEHNLSWIL